MARSGGGPGATVSSFGPLGRFWKNPTCHLFEWVRPSGFVDTARKGRIEPKFEYLSRGDPLDRAEKSRDRTTLFRGQKVKKGSARPPNRYTLKWEAGRPPYGDERSHGLETRHAPPSWAPHSGPRVWGPWRLLKHFMSGRASRQNRACFRVSPIEFTLIKSSLSQLSKDIWYVRISCLEIKNHRSNTPTSIHTLLMCCKLTIIQTGYGQIATDIFFIILEIFMLSLNA